MSGIMSIDETEMTFPDMAKYSIEMADELLKALESD